MNSTFSSIISFYIGYFVYENIFIYWDWIYTNEVERKRNCKKKLMNTRDRGRLPVDAGSSLTEGLINTARSSLVWNPSSVPPGISYSAPPPSSLLTDSTRLVSSSRPGFYLPLCLSTKRVSDPLTIFPPPSRLAKAEIPHSSSSSLWTTAPGKLFVLVFRYAYRRRSRPSSSPPCPPRTMVSNRLLIFVPPFSTHRRIGPHSSSIWMLGTMGLGILVIVNISSQLGGVQDSPYLSFDIILRVSRYQRSTKPSAYTVPVNSSR